MNNPYIGGSRNVDLEILPYMDRVILTLWPWPWLLTYFWKNLTLVITFEPKEIGLQYYTSVFLVTRPFCRYQNFWLSDHDLDFWSTFGKKLTLAITFEPKDMGFFIFQMCIPCNKTFLLEPKFFLPRDLDLDFWPTFEKKNLALTITFELKVIGLWY